MTKAEFFETYNKLKKAFPIEPQTNINSENCDWCDQIFNSGGCYWTFDGATMSDCLYCYDAFQETNDVDCTFCAWTQECYETTDSVESNKVFYSRFIARGYNIAHSVSCVDCHDLFGCVNLTNKSFCIFNVQYTEQEFKEKLEQVKNMPKEEIKRAVNELQKKFPRLHSDYFENTNSEYCDYAYFDKNCYYCFDSTHNEDCAYLTVSHRNKDVIDASYAFQCEQSAEIRDSNACYNSYKLEECGRCIDSFYLYRCLDCQNCFGCVELTHKSYCILNVQYTKEEYEQKLIELKKVLGLYFQ